MRLRSAAILRAIMHDKGISTRQLAERVGCHHSAIDHLLSGRRDTCPDQRARQMASALALKQIDLLFVPEDDTEPAR